MDIGELLPHRASARMLERVIEWNEEFIRVATATHRAELNPLRRAGRLAAAHLVEYGAQAMALHGALKSRAEGSLAPSALLVAARDFRASREFIDDLTGDLELVARKLLATPASFQYAFDVFHQGERIAGGRVAAIVYPLPAPGAAAGNSSAG